VDRDWFHRILAAQVQCQQVPLSYRRWPPVAPPSPPPRVCTYSSLTDATASRYLAERGVLLAQSEVDALHAAGPCTVERPFVVVVGTGMGIAPLVAAARGCHVIVLEPLSGNVGRLVWALMHNGLIMRCVVLRASRVSDWRCPVPPRASARCHTPGTPSAGTSPSTTTR